MSRSRTMLGMTAIGFALALAGCAGGGGSPDMRPIMAMDGQQFDTADPIEKGRAMIVTGQLGLAVETLTKVVGNEPTNARALTLLAVAYGKMKRFDLADRFNAEALQIDPNSVAALNNWGYSYLVRGDRAKAAELLEQAAAAGEVRPIVAANLALARNDGRAGTLPVATPVSLATGPVDAARSVQLSQHVVLVRRTGRLVRLAPGVQMLVTDGQPLALTSVSDPLPLVRPLQQPVQQPMPQPGKSADPLAGTDSRFVLFRALFALMEGKAYPPVEGVRLVAQMATAAGPETTPTTIPAAQTPFGYFPEVDDFTQQ